jgi:hypothetical protein
MTWSPIDSAAKKFIYRAITSEPFKARRASMPKPIATTTFCGIIKSVTPYTPPSFGGYTAPTQYNVIVIVNDTLEEVKVTTEKCNFKEGQSISFTSATGPMCDSRGRTYMSIRNNH